MAIRVYAHRHTRIRVLEFAYFAYVLVRLSSSGTVPCICKSCSFPFTFACHSRVLSNQFFKFFISWMKISNKAIHQENKLLRKRIMYQVIETRVEVWENEKCCMKIYTCNAYLFQEENSFLRAYMTSLRKTVSFEEQIMSKDKN